MFGATNDEICKQCAILMQDQFKMSMMRELNYFLNLQVKQTDKGINICQSKYVKEMLKKFRYDKMKPIGTPMSTSITLYG